MVKKLGGSFNHISCIQPLHLLLPCSAMAICGLYFQRIWEWMITRRVITQIPVGDEGPVRKPISGMCIPPSV